jgi:hypothetical protein
MMALRATRKEHMTRTHTQPEPPESTDLERRVLAHERILKSLIAYMAQTESRFLNHLSKTFGTSEKPTRCGVI